MSDVTIYMIVFGVVIFFVIYLYNRLVVARIRTEEAWSTIDTFLKRRYDLIPNLVEVVKGYAKHESETFEKITKARTMAMGEQTNTTQKGEYENTITKTLKSIFALSENYPDLKASQNFLELQIELSETEDRIQAARQFYNTVVMSYNTMTQVFPSNIFANIFRFKKANFFELEENEKDLARDGIKVELNG